MHSFDRGMNLIELHITFRCIQHNETITKITQLYKRLSQICLHLHLYNYMIKREERPKFVIHTITLYLSCVKFEESFIEFTIIILMLIFV